MKAIYISLALLFGCAGFAQTKESFTVYFDFDGFGLSKNAVRQLDSFWRENKSLNRSLEFELKGFCDSKGSDKYNFMLSDKRVATVKNYFLRRGVNIESFMSTLGFGKTSPLNENRTEEERQLNRRVEITIIKTNDTTISGKEKNGSLKQKIADSTTTTGTNIILRNINFVGGLHQFLPESMPMLEELLDALTTYPKLIIRVEGHICCQEYAGDGPDGETGINNLSEARAKAVCDYLLANGISPDRVFYKGFGHSAPLYPYPEKTEEERSQNRRVEIKIISK